MLKIALFFELLSLPAFQGLFTMSTSTTSFYQEFLMSRGRFKPTDFGVDMEKTEFIDDIVNEFSDYTRGQISLDEMLLRPDTSKAFCNHVRARKRWYDVPDDIILRSVMQRRKNPNQDD